MGWRVWGVTLVATGTALVGFNPKRWDAVLLTFPRGHGIHVRDAIGVLVIAAGVALLWCAPSRH
jgi:hypothetical protein